MTKWLLIVVFSQGGYSPAPLNYPIITDSARACAAQKAKIEENWPVKSMWRDKYLHVDVVCIEVTP